MDKRATITILVGLGIFVVGIVGFVIGGFGIAGIEESREFTLEEVTNGTIFIEDVDGVGDVGVTFWVQGKYLDDDDNGVWDICENVSITVTEKPSVDETWAKGASVYDGDFYSEVVDGYDKQGTSSCDADERNRDFEKSEDGYVKIGRACYGCTTGDFSFESNVNVSVIHDDVFVEALSEDGAMIAIGFLGGFGGLCCGIIIMFIGVILIFTLNEDAPVEMMVGADGMYMMNSMPPNAVGVGVNQNISQVTTSSVVTEDMTKAEPYQFPSTDGTASTEGSNDTTVQPFEFEKN